MRRDGLPLLIVFAGLTVFLFAGSFLFAQEKPSPAPGGEAVPGVEVESKTLITKDYKATPLRSVLEDIATKSGRTIVPSADILGTDLVTISFHETPWREAVDLAADMAQCVTREVGGSVLVEKPPKVTMEFKRAELVEVINLLAKQAGANIVIDKDVKGEVTMRFSDVPWMKALDAVVKTAGFTLVEEDRGRILRIVDPAKLDAQLESRVFHFKFIKPDEYYKAKMPVSPYISGTTPVKADPVKEFTLLDALRSMLTRPPGQQALTGVAGAVRTIGRLDYYPDGNCILVVDTKPTLDRMSQVIQELDIEPEQVYTDLTVVQTTNTDLITIGTNWANGGDNGFEMSTAATTKITSLQNNGTIAGPGKPGGPFQGVVPPPNSITQFPFNFGPSLFAHPFQQGFTNNYAMTATLRLFKEDTDTEFIQRPNICTRNHMETTIFVGEEIHYAEATASQGQGTSTLTLTLAEAAKSPVSVGFQLFLIPHVISGTNKIMMTVIPQNSSLVGTEAAPVPGFNHFEVSSGGTTAAIDLPDLRTQTLITHMLLESGQTMVVGGLIQDRVSKVLRGIPWVKDLPVLGYLFKRKEDTVTKDHLFVFITPRIVPGAQDATKRLNGQLAAHAQDMDKGYIWLQGRADEEALKAALQGRSAQNQKELQDLQKGGPAPAAGGGK